MNAEQAPRFRQKLVGTGGTAAGNADPCREWIAQHVQRCDSAIQAGDHGGTYGIDRIIVRQSAVVDIIRNPEDPISSAQNGFGRQLIRVADARRKLFRAQGEVTAVGIDR